MPADHKVEILDTPFPYKPVLGRDEKPQFDCCGGSAIAPPAGDEVRAGYELQPYVAGFYSTPGGDAARVDTTLSRKDFKGTFMVRSGFGRDSYMAAPGLYAVGEPGPDTPVLVTANYKLTFDSLRKELDGRSFWILVCDTRGVNVWCAAGKKTFSTDEVIRMVEKTRLKEFLPGSVLILPQLAAVGVSARKVRKATGMKTVFGPILARDIPAFVDAGLACTDGMRRVTFTFRERMVLVPNEISYFCRRLHLVFPILFLLSGIGMHVFSLSQALTRSLAATAAYLAGVLAGTGVSVALLRWLPTPLFSIKGAVPGVVAGLGMGFWLGADTWEMLALTLFTGVTSSWACLGFTGSTPYTSLSGVDKEMRRAIPYQAGALLLAAVFWLVAGFLY